MGFYVSENVFIDLFPWALGVIQLTFFLWVKSQLDSQKALVLSITRLSETLSDFKIEIARGYVSKTDMRDFIDRNDKTLSEIKQYLATKKDL